MRALRTAPGLAEQLYSAVLDEICDGTLAPGAHLVQEQLAERFEVSRQPVQQAMARLRADGLVEDVGKRGLRVAALDLDRMQHHYEIRAALDALAARRAAERAQADAAVARDIGKRGRAILADGARAIRDGLTREQIRHDEAFHKLIYDASGNPLLARTAEAHWRFLRRVMGDVLRHAETPREIWRQHGEILAALEAGNPDLAEKLARAHIAGAAGRLAQSLADNGAQEP